MNTLKFISMLAICIFLNGCATFSEEANVILGKDKNTNCIVLIKTRGEYYSFIKHLDVVCPDFEYSIDVEAGFQQDVVHLTGFEGAVLSHGSLFLFNRPDARLDGYDATIFDLANRNSVLGLKFDYMYYNPVLQTLLIRRDKQWHRFSENGFVEIEGGKVLDYIETDRGSNSLQVIESDNQTFVQVLNDSSELLFEKIIHQGKLEPFFGKDIVYGHFLKNNYIFYIEQIREDSDFSQVGVLGDLNTGESKEFDIASLGLGYSPRLVCAHGNRFILANRNNVVEITAPSAGDLVFSTFNVSNPGTGQFWDEQCESVSKVVSSKTNEIRLVNLGD